MGSSRTRSYFLAVLTLGIGVALAAAPARADEFVNRVNAAFARIPKDKRSDLIILPVLARLEAPPAEVDTVAKAVLLRPTNPAWETAIQWAQAQPQRDVLKALADATSDEDFHVAMVFAQGYGIEEVAENTDLIAAGMYTELGDPPSLAGAEFGYLDKMQQMVVLSNIEASRLVNDGDFVGAIDAMFDILYFSRQMADRPMLAEKRFGMVGIGDSLERIRDIVYQDQRADKQVLDFHDLRKYVERFEADRGYLGISRIRPPTGTFVAAEQILSRVLVQRAGVNEGAFATVMARVAAGDRPLRLLSESAYWETIRPLHAGWYESHDMLIGRDGNGGLVNDWSKRWVMSPHDPYVKLASDYQRHVAAGPRFAALRAVLAEVEDLFPMLTALRAEAVGTYTSLAIYGFYREHNQTFPRDISAIRPAYVPRIESDPYFPTARPLGYFVPIRDNVPPQNPRRDPIPWTVRCFPPKPYASFSIPLRDDTFVLYSVGPDANASNAKDATQDQQDLEGDYLLWPPMISLIRQHLIDTGELK